MSSKQIIVTIIALIILGSISLQFMDNDSWQGQGSSVGNLLLEKFDVNQVNKIQIKQEDKELNLSKVGDIWGVENKENYAADFSKIVNVLVGLKDVKIVKTMKVAPEDFSRIGLNAESKPTVLTFLDKSNGVLAEITLGNESEIKNIDEMQMYSRPSNRYVLVKNAKSPVITSNVFSAFAINANNWLNQDFIKIENIDGVKLSNADAKEVYQFAKDVEKKEFAMANYPIGKMLDNTKTNNINSTLQSLRFEDVKKDLADKKIEKTVEIKTADFITYTLSFYKSGEDFWLKIAVSGDLPKERKVGADEKAEDKEKLDKEFVEMTKKHREKLVAEQNYTSWFYKIPSHVFQTLFVDANALLKDLPAQAPKLEEKSTETPPSQLTPAPKLEEKSTEMPPSQLIPAPKLEEKSTETPPSQLTPAPKLEEKSTEMPPSQLMPNPIEENLKPN